MKELCPSRRASSNTCARRRPDISTTSTPARRHAWIARTPRGPKGADFDAAVARWRELRTDDGARFDTEVRIDAADIRPTLTWGTHPGTAIGVDVPVPAATDAAEQKGQDYMRVVAGQSLAGMPVA